MRKIAAYLLCALLLTGALSGCGHRHDWIAADCEHPRTCRECGETEGEALGHSFLPADCTRPERCERCGLTAGEALGHRPTEANYQDGSVCTVCGELLSAPLEADFERWGLRCDMVEGAEYEYRSCSRDRQKTPLTAGVRAENYRIFASDETHPARDGYEWRTVDMVFRFTGEPARSYGAAVADCREDYYTIRLRQDSRQPQTEDGSIETALCSFHGKEYPTELRCEGEWESWRDGQRIYTAHYSVLVPAGYDGAVLGVRDASTEWGEGQYLYDAADGNTLFFRLK